MLKSLTILDLHHAKNVTIEFSEGLNVITGSSGAGKSFIIKALEHLFDAGKGGAFIPADASISAGVIAELQFSRLPEELAASLSLFGITPRSSEAGQLALTVEKRVETGKQCRTRANSVELSKARARELFYVLFDLHRQQDHLWLTKKENYGGLLDAHSTAVTGLHQTYKDCYHKAKQGVANLRTLIASRQEGLARADYLRFKLSELEVADASTADPEELSAKLRGVSAAVEKQRYLAAALNGADPREAGSAEGAEPEHISTALHHSLTAMQRLSELDPDNELVQNACSEMKDITERFNALSAALSGMLDDTVDASAADLLSDRLSKIRSLEQKYGVGSGKLGGEAKAALDELSAIGSIEIEVKDAYLQVSTILKDLGETGSRLSESRTSAAEALNAQLAGELEVLGLDRVQVNFQVDPFRQRLDDKGSAHVKPEDDDLLADLASYSDGFDDIEIFMGYGGQAKQPLRLRASGGELSRVMLAFKSVLSGLAPHKTYIFDEVDAGVSGAIASKVGERLHRIGDLHQTIVISHLPQVVSQADRTVHVLKVASEEGFSMQAQILNEGRQIEEIARLISGHYVTAESIDQAHKLLNERRKRT